MVVVEGKACIDMTKCLGKGNYPRCPQFCDTQYYSCEADTEQAVLSTCPFGLVFDPAPDRVVCTLFNNCSLVVNPITVCPPPATCTEFSLEPKCPTCNIDFYLCVGANQQQLNTTCPTGEVFNPIPSHPGCIPEAKCPCTDVNC